MLVYDSVQNNVGQSKSQRSKASVCVRVYMQQVGGQEDVGVQGARGRTYETAVAVASGTSSQHVGQVSLGMKSLQHALWKATLNAKWGNNNCVSSWRLRG